MWLLPFFHLTHSSTAHYSTPARSHQQLVRAWRFIMATHVSPRHTMCPLVSGRDAQGYNVPAEVSFSQPNQIGNVPKFNPSNADPVCQEKTHQIWGYLVLVDKRQGAHCKMLNWPGIRTLWQHCNPTQNYWGMCVCVWCGERRVCYSLLCSTCFQSYPRWQLYHF